MGGRVSKRLPLTRLGRIYALMNAKGQTTKPAAVRSGARRAVTLMQPPDSRRSLPVFGTVSASDG